MNGCVFCSIVRGEAPASMVYADDKVMAFLDLQPVNSGHVLVIPKAHFAGLSELDAEIGAHMFKVALRVAEALRHSSIKCEGLNLLLADGEVAFQEIFHVHLHVIPRFRDDGFRLKFGPNYGHKPTRRELDEVAEKIRAAMLQRE